MPILVQDSPIGVLKGDHCWGKTPAWKKKEKEGGQKSIKRKGDGSEERRKRGNKKGKYEGIEGGREKGNKKACRKGDS